MSLLGSWPFPKELPDPGITRTTTLGLPWGWLGKELWRASRTPQHPCRFPWKLLQGRILPQGLLEEILEGHLTMQPFLSPKERRARKRHRGLRHRPAPGGRGLCPPAPCPAHLGPLPGRAPGQQRCCFVFKTHKHNGSSGGIAQDPAGAAATRAEMSPEMSPEMLLAHPCLGIPPAQRREMPHEAALLLLPGSLRPGWQQVTSWPR